MAVSRGNSCLAWTHWNPYHQSLVGKGVKVLMGIPISNSVMTNGVSQSEVCTIRDGMLTAQRTYLISLGSLSRAEWLLLRNLT